jgi:serine protease Do
MNVSKISNQINLAIVAASLAGLLLASAPARSYAQQSAPPAASSSARQFPSDIGWLGVGIEEVTPARAQALKLPAARGVYISEVVEDSPAAKAGLQKGDVVTEYNRQSIEGVLEFRRLVRETPPGRAAQLTVWRGGLSQTLTATIGNVPARRRSGLLSNGRNGFLYRMPSFGPSGQWWRGAVMPRQGWFGPDMLNNTPLLGISAQDLSGQLGSYFGAPEDEGVLVTDVHQGSAAARAGMHAGDVIIKLDGQPVRNIGELRMRLRDTRNEKSVTLTILRKGTEMSIRVAPEQAQPLPELNSVFHRRLAT